MQQVTRLLKSRYLYFFLFLCFTACTRQPPARRAITPPVNKLGVHLLLDDGRSQWPTWLWHDHMAYASQLVGQGGFVTELVRLDDLDPDKWQLFMDLCVEFELRPVLRLATVFDQEAGWWERPPVDGNGRYTTPAQQYADFITALNWPTEEHYLVVGNEPNHGDEWGGRPDPIAYAQFLMGVSRDVKTADPDARVLNAPLDQFSPHTGSQPFINGLWYMDAATFLQEMHTAQPAVFDNIDAWASHPYPLGPFTQPPWQQTLQFDTLNDAPTRPAMADAPPNRGINAYEWELWQLAQWGIIDLPVFITETGWRYGEADYPTVEDVTVYLDLALRGNNGRYPDLPAAGWTPWLDDERIIAITPFALDGNPDEWRHSNWLEMDTDGSIRSIQINPITQ
ncbi:MAG: hypothetical protein WAM60_00645 [Candidatus Promineifilaceae bacterium]